MHLMARTRSMEPQGDAARWAFIVLRPKPGTEGALEGFAGGFSPDIVLPAYAFQVPVLYVKKQGCEFLTTSSKPKLDDALSNSL